MSKNAFRTLLFPLLLIVLVGLACGVSVPKEVEVVATAAAVVPTLEAAATQMAPAVDAISTQASELAATAMVQVTEAVPTLEAVATALAPVAETAATVLPALPLPTPDGGIEEFLDQVQGSEGLSGLTSFRQTAVLDFEDAGQTGKVDYWGEFTTSPQATHGRVTLSGQAAAGLPLPTFEYVIIDGAAWVKIGPLPWQAIPEGVETVTGQQPYSADDFLFAVPAAQRVLPDETLNGIECKHYVYNVSDVSFEGGSLSSAQGEIYTAVDGGYVVQYTLQGEGSLEKFFTGQTGTINLVYDLFDVNADFMIEPPR
jgi:hypothetical protein